MTLFVNGSIAAYNFVKFLSEIGEGMFNPTALLMMTTLYCKQVQFGCLAYFIHLMTEISLICTTN